MFAGRTSVFNPAPLSNSSLRGDADAKMYGDDKTKAHNLFLFYYDVLFDCLPICSVVSKPT